MEFIINGVTAFCGENLALKEEQAIWIKDEMIYKVLPSDQIPSDKHVIDRSGMFLLPGLIDLHVHIIWDGETDPVKTNAEESYEQIIIRAVTNYQKYITKGITTIRDLGSIKDIALHVAEAADRNLIAGSRLVACGKTITMTGGHDPFWGSFSDGPSEVLKATREQIYKHAGVIKVSATGGVYGRSKGEVAERSELTYEELKIICEEANRFDLKVASHAIGREGIINSINAGVDSIEHGHYIDEEIVELMNRKGSSWVPTLEVYQKLASLEHVPLYAREKAKKVIEAHEKAFCQFFDQVLVGAGSDAGSISTPHPSLLGELHTMNKYVNNPRDILKTATVNAGKILGIPTGQITEGYFADFILMDQNPLLDLNHLEEIKEVYLEGKRFV
ncbi:amidohydrolase family protein [Siminovitchia sp. FSL H7-0308]|uniref:Imidazolonepropionase-like amidohydrolase n=1 Tax=Siminovitchia thermophila TaxID=1245522 RepID=A0ABS2R5D1_9BACI|nr:amidohydrolase family protein [Siminovitchia thermophila]MBM7714865.1 imidazolonepropionase-like amidohydrolase [Siminovitchia thermophila]